MTNIENLATKTPSRYAIYLNSHHCHFYGIWCLSVSTYRRGLRVARFNIFGQCQSLRVWDEWQVNFPTPFFVSVIRGNDILLTGTRTALLCTQNLNALWNAPIVEKRSLMTQCSVVPAEQESKEMMFLRIRINPLRTLLPTTLQIPMKGRARILA